jgi:hypothetical protein
MSLGMKHMMTRAERNAMLITEHENCFGVGLRTRSACFFMVQFLCHKEDILCQEINFSEWSLPS